MRFFFVAFLFVQLHEAGGQWEHGCTTGKKNEPPIAPDTFYCAICLEDVDKEKGCTAPCDHTFCKPCIYPVGGMNPFTKCPLCRREFENPLLKLNRDLWEAAESGRAEAVKSLLEEGARIDSVDFWSDKTALHHAVLQGHAATVKVLLAYGANINIQTRLKLKINPEINPDYGFSASSPFLLAAAKCDWPIVEMFIEKEGNREEYANIIFFLLGNDVPHVWKQRLGRKALQHAVAKGYADIVTILLDKNTDVNFVCGNSGEYNALHVAVKQGSSRTDVIKALLSGNADVNAQDKLGNTPLIEAVKKNFAGIALILLEKNALVNVKNNRKQTALHFAMENGNSSIITEALLARNADVDVQDQNGDTPRKIAISKGFEQARKFRNKKAYYLNRSSHAITLHHAAQYYDIWTVNELLKMSPEVNAQIGQDKETALMVASRGGRQGRVQIVKNLLEKGADVRLTDRKMNTALHYAVYNKEKSIVELLLKNGADEKLKNCNGQTAYDLARDEDCRAELLSQMDKDQSLRESACDGDMEQMKSLIANCAKVGSVDEYKCTALHYAAKNGHESAAKLLLEHNANVNAQDEKGDTPLIVATSKRYENKVNLLLEEGADPNLKENMVQILLARGADPRVKNKRRETALHCAAYHGDESITEFLLDGNANVDAQDEKNDTPLIIATRRQHENTVRILLSYGADLCIRNFNGETAFMMRGKAAKKNDKTGEKRIIASQNIEPEKKCQKIKSTKNPSWNKNF